MLRYGSWAIASGAWIARKRRPLVAALAIAAVAPTLALPAAAQFSGGRSAFIERPGVEPVQFNDFLQFPWNGGRGASGQPRPYNAPYAQRAPQVFESIRPPLPRKLETPPASTVLVVGDSLADWLGYGLEEAFADTPDVGIVRRVKLYSGLVRYEAARGDVQEWSQAIKDLIAADKPAAIVVMLGVNDRLPLRERTPAKAPAAPPQAPGQPPAAAAAPADTPETPDADSEQQPAIAAHEAPRRGPGAMYEFHSDRWGELYSKRIDQMIAALKSKGVPVVWVGLPAVRGPRATTDMSYLDELYRARADKAGITYVDIWDGFVDDKGNFAVQGPDFEGQIRRLRTYDGINFTKAGAEKLAHYVERELRRLLTSHVVPIALPSPEEPVKGNARPAIGPVLPLNATASGEGGDLLGAASRPTPATPDPIVSRVLGNGDAIPPLPGRADDFSWPRTDANAASADTMPAPPVEPAPPAKGPSKAETKKPGEGKAPAGPNVARRPLLTAPAHD